MRDSIYTSLFNGLLVCYLFLITTCTIRVNTYNKRSLLVYSRQKFFVLLSTLDPHIVYNRTTDNTVGYIKGYSYYTYPTYKGR